MNDVAGNYSCVGPWLIQALSNPQSSTRNCLLRWRSLTLVDVLDTFVVLQDRAGFERAVRNVIQHVSYDVDTRPQVFEVTIRALGGLLSGHIFASEPQHGFALDWYSGELLRCIHLLYRSTSADCLLNVSSSLALDLGERLLPAFNTATGMPYARVRSACNALPSGHASPT